ncbi:hypothetical protein FAZ19_18900 [Sphingobacterium alkalisoli]|uniref:Uncharacterized protein n=1 Tax=Sphingobacterium alkalisoli TaxID=1874115 RepID=A0A4U0GU23_9SPHI|nr:hypothetical protein [Sphingobacterium alkalisoli]TJY62545.1 hypothetical protein FAZ19_18900 [Sphingobacterium alkalisoli]GGH27344.1 hypothetical protein GCM10011418_37230 [Sphingobacterium alkalisoli]
MKEPIEVLVLERQIIKFFDEADYRFDTLDNIKTYEKFFISGDRNMLTSQIGIEIFEDDILKSSCLIGSEGGGTGINGNTTLISYGGIVICCSNTVFKLTIPNLDLEWKTIADTMTCFGIHYLDEDYVVHGELEISRLDKDGKIIWQQGGRDIWTTAEAFDDFAVYDNYILATDWEYNRYKYDFDGNLLEEYKVEQNKVVQTEENIKIKKWWKFW